MTQMAIYDRIRARTKEQFGVAINPHLFRDAAATTMAIADPANVRLAAPLLGHRTFTTTEKILPTGARPGSSSRLCRRHSWQGWRSMNDFHRPTPEEFDELVRDQKLDGLQAHELRLVLYHVDEDLKEYRKRLEGRKPRRELVRRLKRVRESLGDLEFELRSLGEDDRRLPALRTRRRKLGCSCPSVRWRLRSREKFERLELRSEIESLSSECPDFRMAQLEERLLNAATGSRPRKRGRTPHALRRNDQPTDQDLVRRRST